MLKVKVKIQKVILKAKIVEVVSKKNKFILKVNLKRLKKMSINSFLQIKDINKKLIKLKKYNNIKN